MRGKGRGREASHHSCQQPASLCEVHMPYIMECSQPELFDYPCITAHHQWSIIYSPLEFSQLECKLPRRHHVNATEPPTKQQSRTCVPLSTVRDIAADATPTDLKETLQQPLNSTQQSSTLAGVGRCSCV